MPSSYLSRIFDSITMHREKLRNSKGGGKLESMKKRLRGGKIKFLIPFLLFFAFSRKIKFTEFNANRRSLTEKFS